MESRRIAALPDQLGRARRLGRQLRCEATDLVASPRDLKVAGREIHGVPDVGAHILQADLGPVAACDVGEDGQDGVG